MIYKLIDENKPKFPEDGAGSNVQENSVLHTDFWVAPDANVIGFENTFDLTEGKIIPDNSLVVGASQSGLALSRCVGNL